MAIPLCYIVKKAHYICNTVHTQYRYVCNALPYNTIEVSGGSVGYNSQLKVHLSLECVQNNPIQLY